MALRNNLLKGSIIWFVGHIVLYCQVNKKIAFQYIFLDYQGMVGICGRLVGIISKQSGDSVLLIYFKSISWNQALEEYSLLSLFF